MHKYLHYLIILIVILFFNSCKKDLLHWQHVAQLNSNTVCELDNIRFISNNICIAAGGIKYEQSEVLRSTDGGYTWANYSDTNAKKEMFGMGVSFNGNIFLSGIDGDVLHSSDSGQTWKFNRINNWLANVGGTFATPDTGLFVSSILQKQSTITRTDSNFNILDQQTFLFGLNNIYMTTPGTGYVIGYGAVMKTDNCGNSWNFQSPVDDNFTAMDIHGEEMWMCGSNGSVYHTTDGGNNWQRQRNGNDITHVHYGLRCILFKDETNGWAAGDNGKIIHSDDGGNHWEEYSQVTTNTIRSMALCPNQDLLVVGDNGCIFRLTTN